MTTFHNDDTALRQGAERVLEMRRTEGLEGLVGGLECLLVNVAEANFTDAVEEFLRHTGLDLAAAFSRENGNRALLRGPAGADILVKTRPGGDNPFAAQNRGAKTGPYGDEPRLETFVFACHDLDRYVAVQKKRGVAFMNPDITRTSTYDFIQTMPSAHTGNSLGFVQWKGGRREYVHDACLPLALGVAKPARAHLSHIGGLDHVATRVKARDRDPAILEFMALTNYAFDFAVYVEALNSITNVARLPGADYAQVFTSGISPLSDEAPSGPTELFIRNYGTRPHHVAFNTVHIDAVVAALAEDGLGYISDLVGSPAEGLKQIFTRMSPTTLLVTEYIQRFDGFDGFFTKSNVTHLTKATEKQ